MYITTTGLVLRETEYKESSRILTVLTPGEGKIAVAARGAKRRDSKLAAAVQFLAFSEMTLSNSRGRWVLTEARSLELFEGLRDDVALLALGAYFAEALELLCTEDMPAPEALSLCLNSLFALSEGEAPPELVKPVFELRLMCLAGYEPVLDKCAVCSRPDIQSPVLDLSGGVRCAGCAGTSAAEPLTAGALEAMRHIVSADSKKIFSFRLGKEGLACLGRACERYMAAQLDYSSRALEYYKNIRIQDT